MEMLHRYQDICVVCVFLLECIVFIYFKVSMHEILCLLNFNFFVSIFIEIDYGTVVFSFFKWSLTVDFSVFIIKSLNSIRTTFYICVGKCFIAVFVIDFGITFEQTIFKSQRKCFFTIGIERFYLGCGFKWFFV